MIYVLASFLFSSNSYDVDDVSSSEQKTITSHGIQTESFKYKTVVGSNWDHKSEARTFETWIVAHNKSSCTQPYT